MTRFQDARTDDHAALLIALHRRARRLVACPHEAADMAQDAALKVWIRAAQGDDIDDLTAYAMTTLRNLARSRWRNRRETSELTEDMGSTPPQAMGRIACAELRAALKRLPRAQADLMALVAEGETSPADLADLTGQPLGTVMSRLARARAALRARMGLGKDTPSRTLLDSDRG